MSWGGGKMDVMALRRSLLMQSVQQEQWDYILYPTSPNAEGYGKWPIKRVNLQIGDTITIQYNGVTSRSPSLIFLDGYYARTKENGETMNIYNYSFLTSDNGTIVLTATKAGYISIGGSRNSDEGTNSTSTCKEIRIKVN